MSIRLTQSILIAGAHTPVDGATLSLSAAMEAGLVNSGKAVYVVNPNQGGQVPVMGGFDPVTGEVETYSAGIKFVTSPPSAKNTFCLMIGSDHAFAANWGVGSDSATPTPDGRGFLRMLQDGGLKPYMAITTSPDVAHAPGSAEGMSWEHARTMQARGVEMLSHSHQHIQRWDRLNTGLFITYTGANATATVQISDATITLAAGADSLVITRSTLATLRDVVTAIDSVSGWDASINDSAALLGAEPQKNLLSISGARNAKNSTAGDGRYYCCGGGLHVWCGNTGAYAQVPEHVRLRVRTNGWLEVIVDGTARWYGDLSAAANDTFSKLVSVLNAALNAAGVYFALADNGQSDPNGATFRNYMRGDELAAVLKHTTNRVVGNAAITPVVIEAGLTQDYIRERQYDKSIELAAANGVSLTGFAEPGNQWYPWHMRGYNKFNAYRGTLYSRQDQQPVTYPLAALNTPFFVRSSCIVSGGYSTEAHLTALAEAMADSPGHACCILWHSLSTTGAGGNQGYDLGNIVSLRDQDAANVRAFLAALKPHIDSGKVTPVKLREAANYVSSSREPFNWLFNAGFKNPGAAVPINSVNNSSLIPGWLTTLSNTSGATVTLRSDGLIELSSPSAAADFSISQSVILDRNSVWEYGADVRESSLAAGNGVVANILRTMGRPANGNNAEVNTSVGASIASAGSEPGTAAGLTGVGSISGRLALPTLPTGFDGARMVGIAGPFTITGGSNDTLSITINGIPPGAALTLTPGTRTAPQIVAEILAWMQTDSVFGTYPEFWAIAKARRAGRSAPAVILGDLPNVYNLSCTGTSLLTVFGGISTGAGHIANGYSGPDMDSGLFAVTYQITVNFQGTIVVGRPYVKRMEMM